MADGPILLATDLTARSDRAFDRAVDLAAASGARLVIAHAIDAPDQATQDELTARARDAIARSLEGLEGDFEIAILDGEAPDAVAAAAEDLAARLVVIGPARFNDVKDHYLGTAVDFLVRRVDRPVLVVKQRPRGAYRRIVVGTDFSDGALTALLVAADLFPDAGLVVVGGYLTPFPSRGGRAEMSAYAKDMAREEMTRFMASPQLAGLADRITSRVDEGDAATVVERVADEVGATLVVIGAHGASGFVQAVLGSRASEILGRVSRDTLVVRRSVARPPA